MASRVVGDKIGFTENEQAEFTRALHQQLLVQTPLQARAMGPHSRLRYPPPSSLDILLPLQVLLETLFSRLQNQAQLFNDLQRRVSQYSHESFAACIVSASYILRAMHHAPHVGDPDRGQIDHQINQLIGCGMHMIVHP